MEYYFSGLEGHFLSSAGAWSINGSTRIKKAFHLVTCSLANVITDFVLTVRFYITQDITALMLSCNQSVSELRELGL